MAGYLKVGSVFSVMFSLLIVAGLVLIIIEGLKAQDDDRIARYNSYSGDTPEYRAHELRRDMYFQMTVVVMLLALVMNLPFGEGSKKKTKK